MKLSLNTDLPFIGPDFSVVIPCYNSEKWIGKAVESVLDQSYPAAEVIVVNDGSTDNSSQLLARYGNSIQVINQENRGLSAARNAGAKHARSPWLTFLDSDDYYLKDFLARVADLITAFPHIEMSFCDYHSFFDDEEVVPSAMTKYVPSLPKAAKSQEGSLILCNAEISRMIIERNGAFAPSSLVIRRKLFEDNGGFFESLRGAEDLDFYIRLVPRAQVGIVNEPLLRKREHRQSLNRNYEIMRGATEAVMNRGVALCKKQFPDLLPVVTKKHCGLLQLWANQERNLGLYAQARQTYWSAIKISPLSIRAWKGYLSASWNKFFPKPASPIDVPAALAE